MPLDQAAADAAVAGNRPNPNCSVVAIDVERRRDHPPPARWEDFEDLCLQLWRRELKDPKKHGRSGQAQHGVDIYGQHRDTGEWWAIQCKQKTGWPNNVLSTDEIEAEVGKAEGFDPPLSHYIVATTTPRDAKVQKSVRKLSDSRHEKGLFTVDIVSWDDTVDRIYEDPGLCGKLFGHVEEAGLRGFDTFLRECSALRGATCCTNCRTMHPDDPGTGMLFGCIEGNAEVVKLFVNELGNSGQVANIKVRWEDWFKDCGYGVHADREKAESLLAAVVIRYAPKHLAKLKRGYFNRESLAVTEGAFRLVVTHAPGRCSTSTPRSIPG